MSYSKDLMFNKHVRNSCSVFGVTLNLKGDSDSTFKRKMERHCEKGWTSKQFPNLLTSGFTIGTTYHYAKNEYGFTIKDPRGYEIAISSDNLENIIKHSVIDHGVIQDKCKWTDSGVLKTETEFEADLKYEAKQVKPVYLKMAKVPVGTVVEDANGRRYVWMGAYHTILEQFGTFKWSISKIQYSIDMRHFRRNDEVKKEGLLGGKLQKSVIKFVKISERDEPYDVPDPKNVINTMLYDVDKGKQKQSRKYVSDKRFDFEYKLMPNVPKNCIFRPDHRHGNKYAVNITTGSVNAFWTQPKTLYSSEKKQYSEVTLVHSHKFWYKKTNTGTFYTINSTVCDMVLWNNDTNKMLSFFKEESVEGD